MLYLIVLLLIIIFQRRLLYPIRTSSVSASYVHGANEIRGQNGEHYGYHIIPKEQSFKIGLVVFHGNAGDASDRIPYGRTMARHLNTHVWCIEYPGYGKTEGKPSEKSIVHHSSKAVQHIIENYTDKIVLHGASLGGAVAIQIAVEFPDNVKGVVLENTFTNLTDTVRKTFPLCAPIFPILRLLLFDKWKNNEYIQRLHCPVLFIRAQNDTVIDPSNTTVLSQLCSTSYQTKSFDYGGHMGCSIEQPEMYWDTVAKFILMV